MWQTSILGT